MKLLHDLFRFDSAKWSHLFRLCVNRAGQHMILPIAVICVTKSRTGNYDFRACARARVSPVVQCSVGNIRFAVCAERSRDNNLRFLRQFHLDKI